MTDTAKLRLLDLQILLLSAKIDRDLDLLDDNIDFTRRWLATLGE